MTSVVDIRPAVDPMPLSEALEGLEVEALLDADGAALAPSRIDGIRVSGVTVSSADCEPGWVFIAVPGFTQHGVRFAPAAAAKGASVLVTDSAGVARAREEGVDLPVVVVADPRSAAAVMARTVYGAPAEAITTMAVTGTNGKTTTSFLMRAALAVAFPRASICGTVETRVGGLRFRSDQTTAESPVVERILALTAQEGLGAAVVETSSHALSLGRVDGIVFDVVAFTNLQHDHLDYYGDMEHYFEAKKELFTPARAKRGVVCVDDEWGRRLAAQAQVPVTTLAALSEEDADWRVRGVRPDPVLGRIVFELVDPAGLAHPVEMPILGEVNVQNTALAIVATVSLGYDTDEVIAALEKAEQIPGRMQKVNPEPGDRPLVIVDYAHTPEAMEWTLRSTRELTSGRLVAVFGTDGDRDASKREELAEIAAREADVLWITDENPRTEDPQKVRDYLMRGVARVRPGLEGITEVRTCRRDAVRKAILAASPGDTVIITGKGAEWYQDIEGVKHEYNDVPVALEVLKYYASARM